MQRMVGLMWRERVREREMWVGLVGLSLSYGLLPGRSSVGSGGGDPWTMEEESECAKLCDDAMKYCVM